MQELIQELVPEIASYIRSHALPTFAITVIGILLIKLIRRGVRKALERSKLEKAAHSLIRSLVNISLYIVLIVAIASSVGLDITGLVAMASVFSLALSLAVQDILANVFGGMILLYTQPFHSGNYVEIAGQSGTVKEVGLAYTKLTTVDNRIVSIPNSAVASTQIINYSETGTRRIDVVVRASYNTPPEKVIAALKKAALAPTVLDKPVPVAGVKEYKDSAIEYVLWVWTTAANYWTTTFTVNQNVKEAFDEAGVEFTYPHINVHMSEKNISE